MSSTKARLAVLLAAVVVAVGLFAILRGGDEEAPSPSVAQEEGGGGGEKGSGGKLGREDVEQAGEGTAGEKQRAPVTTIEVRDGQAVGGVAKIEAQSGGEVRFEVHSDEATELHVHGYEITEELPAGKSTEVSFPADVEGAFEIEVHANTGDVQIGELEVTPG